MYPFVADNGANMIEPFPPFLLRHQEVREREGYLKRLQTAMEQGKEVKDAKLTE